MVLSLVVCFFVGSVGAQGQNVVPKVLGVSEEAAPTSVSDAVEIPEDVATGRDPFEKALPVEEPEVSPERAGDSKEISGLTSQKEFDPSLFDVSGLVWGIEESRAIINGQIVGVGSVVEDATIKKIDKEGILLEFDGQEVLLKRNMGAEHENKS
jgi:hypothetical protein